MRMIVRGARLYGGGGELSPSLMDVEVGEDGRVARVVPYDDQKEPPATGVLIEAHGDLLSPPFVEPHIHLDTALTAGEPRWNASGTLWEGIACWSARKQSLTREDVVARATEVLRWQAAQGVLHVRTHCDVTDPQLTALDALVEVRDRVREVMTLQIVAFPQEGIVSFPGGQELMRTAVARGADVVGAIPHFEDTREDGVASLHLAFELAERHGLRVDAHCDEIDDEQSRFVEVMAALALRTGLRDRVTASHTTAMGSYNGAYSYKLQRLLRRSGVHLVCNPFANLALQGRFDGYPRRRGLTQVKEMLGAGVNVAFGHDDVMDPWNPLGTGNPLQTALTGLYAAQLTGADEIPTAFSMVTDRAAAVLGLADYAIAPGAPASFVLLPARTPYDALRRQVRPTHVVSHGSVLATTAPTPTRLTWPGEPPAEVSFARPLL
ncbi:cytosine deaminase [Streptomyces antimicrobicus]|uniref:Cytosine deaminase n=1 Tax=Streptomyces antimicrobicus TaxID=2883108 RepID=A0ABS8B291_9ACTN|nr:cytosine deaminase [Streptomyces antimicrobicus]MCB5178729.1 cytosine deaminase [Streptomyces antimicrobicus]